MTHLTDSSFEAVKISQGYDRCWKTVPLNDCKRIEWVFIIISPGWYLPVSQWVACTRSTRERYDIWRERYSYVAIDNLTKKDQSWIRTPRLEVTPSKFPYHVCDAWVGGIIPKDPSLNTLNFICICMVTVKGLFSITHRGESNLVALWESLFDTLYCLCEYCFCVKMVPLHYCSNEEWMF